MAPFARTTVPAHLRDPNYTTGRPSLYRPEYCDMVVADMARGYSLTAFAGLIGVSVDTVFEWIKRHAAFSEAVNRARPGRTRAYETKLLSADKGGEVAAAIFGLKNCDPQEWKEVRNVSHEHSVRMDMLTDAQLNAIASQKAGANGTVIDGEYTRADTV